MAQAKNSLLVARLGMRGLKHRNPTAPYYGTLGKVPLTPEQAELVERLLSHHPGVEVRHLLWAAAYLGLSLLEGPEGEVLLREALPERVREKTETLRALGL